MIISRKKFNEEIAKAREDMHNRMYAEQANRERDRDMFDRFKMVRKEINDLRKRVNEIDHLDDLGNATGKSADDRCVSPWADDRCVSPW